MAQRRQLPTYPPTLIPFVIGYVERCGSNANALKQRYGRSGRTGVNAPQGLTLAQFRRLFSEGATATKDPLFGLHLAQSLPRGTYGLLEFALRSASTGREAISQLAEFGALINPSVRFTMETDGDVVSIHHRVPNEKNAVGPHGNLYTVARLVFTGRELVSADLRPLRAWFAHAQKGVPPALVEALGTDRLDFGRTTNGVSFAAADLERPCVGADPELNAVLCQHARALLVELPGEDLNARVRQALFELIPTGRFTLEAVGKRLQLSARTLQRRLDEEALAFATLVTEVRHELAMRLLASAGVSLDDVAARVGYGDASAFVRAFKRWTGETPGAWRGRHAS